MTCMLRLNEKYRYTSYVDTVYLSQIRELIWDLKQLHMLFFLFSHFIRSSRHRQLNEDGMEGRSTCSTDRRYNFNCQR
jgi:hypothetical protein